MERELMQLLAAARKAADAANAKGVLSGQTEASRCVDVLTRLKTFPVNRKVLASSPVVEGLEHLTKHNIHKIRSFASSLLLHWKQAMAAAGKDQDSSKKRAKGLVSGHRKDCSKPGSSFSSARSSVFSLDCSSRRPERLAGQNKRDCLPRPCLGFLVRRKRRVIERQVEQCSLVELASAIEAVMFEKLGSFNGNKKNKHRSILFSVRDPKNPDLRRKLLLGQVTPERLVDMSTEEMASNELQREINDTKERVGKRERGSHRQSGSNGEIRW